MAQTMPNFSAVMRRIYDEELAQSMMPQRKPVTTDAVRQRYIELANKHNPGAFPMPEANPKAGRAVADGKAPLDYLEPVCDAGEARVLKGGADKYGRRNFRDPSTEMLWSTYLGSMRRHLNALHAGEDLDPDSGEHHLSHIRANTAVLMAAMDAGTLCDDRLETTVTARSSAVHKYGNQDAKADSHIIHYTAADIGAVEPFVVDAKCCGGPSCTVDEACTYFNGKWCDGMVVA